MQLFLHFVQLVVKMPFELEHIGPLARFVDLYDYICVFIAYNPHLLLVMNQQYILCGCSASVDSRLFFVHSLVRDC